MLSRDDCQVLRGLAITSIFIHNYCHMLPNAVHENEFWFSEENNNDFWMNVLSSDVIVQLFSYLGHLGVPVFVFLTGYGLSVKYGQSNKVVGVKSFVWNHYRKFFPMMFLGMLAFLAIYWLLNESLWTSWWQTFVAQMTMTCNMVMHPDCLIKPGPYWYFGMTMQLYVIYRLLVYRRDYRYLIAVVFLSVIFLLVLEGHRYSLIWVKYNSLGWLLPFALGVWAPIIKDLSFVKRWEWLSSLIVAAVCVFWGGGYYVSWVFLPVVALIFFIILCKVIGQGFIYRLAKNIGNLSLYIFVAHPILREIVRYFVGNDYRYGGLVMYVISVVICAWCLQKLTKHTIA